MRVRRAVRRIERLTGGLETVQDREIEMSRTSILAATLVAGALVTAGASAQTFETYATEGEWEIAINQNMGPGCVAIQRFVDPTSQVQMGIDARQAERTGYIAILVEGAEGIAAGQKIPASFDVDGRVFEGTLTGQQTEGFGGATVPVDNPEFIYDLANNKTLTISFGEGKRLIVDLTGSDAAFAALRACQAAQ